MSEYRVRVVEYIEVKTEKKWIREKEVRWSRMGDKMLRRDNGER